MIEKCGGTRETETFQQDYRHWVEESLNSGNVKKEPVWTESIAVGTKVFIEEIRKKLGYKAKGRKVIENGDTYTLRELQNFYNTDFDHQNSLLSPQNAYNWNALNE